MNSLIQLDKEILLYLNSFGAPVWDYFFWFFSGTLVWIPLYASLLYLIIKKTQLNSLWIILAITLTIVLCDQISSGLFKPLFERLRPSHDHEIGSRVILLHGFKAGKFGFVSSHAANTFGLSTLISLLFRNRVLSIFFILWATINSYSRIYLGLHYLGDIIAGALIGILSAMFVFYLYKNIVLTKYSSNKTTISTLREDKNIGNNVIIVGLVSIAIMFLSSLQLIKII